jgi:phosphohistidine swiveling domain-containing protein
MQNSNGFNPPGPGVWEIEGTHMVRPLARSMAGVFPDAATEGFRQGMARYGMLLDHLEFKAVNRFIYICARPVGAPKGAKGPPPKLIFKLLTKIHPEMRKRIRRIAEVFANKSWREDVEMWDREWKPAIARRHTELQNVDLAALTDEQLIAHLDRVVDAVRRAITGHHSLNATAMLPLGDFLVHVKEWTGLSPYEVLPLFRGSSRISRGAVDELESLGRALHAHPDAATLLAAGESQAIVDALTSRSDAVGVAAKRYLEVAGVRVSTGYDVADFTLAEMPDLVVENMRSAFAATNPAASLHDLAALEQSIRDRVPAMHRPMFDELLAEARLTYRMRDERVYYNDAWAVGLCRRAILEAGRRLVANRRLHDAQHAVELTLSEMQAMLRGGVGPVADEVAEHVTYRTTSTTKDAPKFLGGTPSGPPPIDWFPPVAARAERAIAIVMGEMFAAREKQELAAKVSGFAASPGLVSGVARLVLEPRDMEKVRKGDLLITRSTSPAYNALLPLIAGVVTDRGGTLSHAAVVAREYGIPAVVGTGNATELIRDGAHVRIDGAKGIVEVLA